MTVKAAQGQAKKRNPHTRWGKSSNEALVSEMLAPEDDRPPYDKLAYGEKNSYIVVVFL
jgi:hypothetical protein